MSDEEMDIPVEEGFITPPKTVKQPKPTINDNISTANKFGLLEKHKDIENASVTAASTGATIGVRRTWIPPIILHERVEDYRKFSLAIKNIIKSDKFTLMFKSNAIKITCSSLEDFHKLKRELKSEKTQFYTHTPKEEQVKKLVMKAAPNMDPMDIKNELLENDIAVQDVKLLKGKSKNPYSYLVYLNQSVDIGKLKKNITSIGHLKVKFEKFLRKNNYTQCHRCQGFGHGESNCNRAVKCVKCPADHHYRECPLQKTEVSKAYCVNCKGDHSANYSKCPALLSYLQSRTNGKQPQVTQKALFNRASYNNNVVREGISYSQATRSIVGASGSATPAAKLPVNLNDEEQAKDFRLVMDEIKGLSQVVNLKQVLSSIRALKRELAACRSSLDRMLVLQRYAEEF